MSEYDLKKLAQEDKKFFYELVTSFKNQETFRSEELFGFQLPKNRCFVPSIPCGDTTTPLMSLVPLYETILLPIYSSYWPHKGSQKLRIEEDSMFKRQHGATPSDLIVLAEKGRVIPYFSEPYDRYTEKIIEPLLQPGIPRISYGTMMLIRNLSMGTISSDRERKHFRKLASEDIGNFDFPKEKEFITNCTVCLSVCYTLGLREHFKALEFGLHHACFVTYALSAQTLDAVLQTECPLAKDVLSNIGNLPEGIQSNTYLKVSR